jgi:hypothetical protein
MALLLLVNVAAAACEWRCCCSWMALQARGYPHMFYQVSKVDENNVEHQVLMRMLDHVEQRLESVKDNASSYLASPELHHSLLFFLEVTQPACALPPVPLTPLPLTPLPLTPLPLTPLPLSRPSAK